MTKSKSLFGVILMLLVFFPAMIMFAACGDPEKKDNAVTITVSDKVYDGQPNVATATATHGTPVVVYKELNAADTTYTATAPTNAGQYTVSAAVAGDNEYNPGAATKNFTISKAQSNIAITSNISKDFDDEAVTAPTVEKSTDGQVSFAYKAKNAADSTYVATAPTAAGNYVVKATLAATTNYAASFATADFVIRGESEILNIELNPEIQFVLNAGTVTAVTALNDDAKVITAAADFGGLTAQEATNLFVTVAKQQGFIADEDDFNIEISGTMAAADLNNLKTGVETYMEDVLNINDGYFVVGTTALDDSYLDNLAAEIAIDPTGMTRQQLLNAISKAREEIEAINSTELENLYEMAKAQAVFLARLSAINTIISEDQTLASLSQALETAIETIEDTLDDAFDTVIEQCMKSSSGYMTTKAMWVSAKRDLLAAKAANDTAVIQNLEIYEGMMALTFEMVKTYFDEGVAQYVEMLNAAAETIKPTLENGLLVAAIAGQDAQAAIAAAIKEAEDTYLSAFLKKFEGYNSDLWTGTGIKAEGDVVYVYFDAEKNLTYSFNDYSYQEVWAPTTTHHTYVCYVYEGQVAQSDFATGRIVAIKEWQAEEDETSHEVVAVSFNDITNETFTVNNGVLTPVVYEVTGATRYISTIDSMGLMMTVQFNVDNTKPAAEQQMAYVYFGEYADAQELVGKKAMIAIPWELENGIISATYAGEAVYFAFDDQGANPYHFFPEPEDGIALKVFNSGTGASAETWVFYYVPSATDPAQGDFECYVYNGTYASVDAIAASNPRARATKMFNYKFTPVSEDRALITVYTDPMDSSKAKHFICSYTMNAQSGMPIIGEGNKVGAIFTQFYYVAEQYQGVYQTYIFTNYYNGSDPNTGLRVCTIYYGQYDMQTYKNGYVMGYGIYSVDENIVTAWIWDDDSETSSRQAFEKHQGTQLLTKYIGQVVYLYADSSMERTYSINSDNNVYIYSGVYTNADQLIGHDYMLNSYQWQYIEGSNNGAFTFGEGYGADFDQDTSWVFKVVNSETGAIDFVSILDYIDYASTPYDFTLSNGKATFIGLKTGSYSLGFDLQLSKYVLTKQLVGSKTVVTGVYAVTALDKDAFLSTNGAENIVTISLPNSIEIFVSGNFANCTNDDFGFIFDGTVAEFENIVGTNYLEGQIVSIDGTDYVVQDDGTLAVAE